MVEAQKAWFLAEKLWLARWALDATTVPSLVRILYPGLRRDDEPKLVEKYRKYFDGGSTHDKSVLEIVAEALEMDRSRTAAELMRVAPLEFFDVLSRESKARVLASAPRERLEAILGIDYDSLRARIALKGPSEFSDFVPSHMSLVETMNELPEFLVERLKETKRSLKAVRVASPYRISGNVQEKFRTLLAKRILEGSIEVQRAEIFYTLERLGEVLSNILRYQGRAYWVKSYCAGRLAGADLFPALGAYIFDDESVLIGGYWKGLPPHDRRGLWLTGAPAREFFGEYWKYIWEQGTLLNPSLGITDVREIQQLAFDLGLQPDQWEPYLEEAKLSARSGDVPPLV